MPKEKDFANMSLDELVAIRDRIGRAIQAKVAEERAELQKRLEALSGFKTGGGAAVARGRGRVSVPSNGNGKRRVGRLPSRNEERRHALAGRKVPIKYRGPDGETWTGRGLAPRWLTELQAKGKKREAYLVE